MLSCSANECHSCHGRLVDTDSDSAAATTDLAPDVDYSSHFDFINVPVAYCSVCEQGYHQTIDCASFWGWMFLTRDGVDYSVCLECIERRHEVVAFGWVQGDEEFDPSRCAQPLAAERCTALMVKMMLHQRLYARDCERELREAALASRPAPPAPAKRSHSEVGTLSHDTELAPSLSKRQKREEWKDAEVHADYDGDDETEGWNLAFLPRKGPSAVF
jgi:hypothetical protein